MTRSKTTSRKFPDVVACGQIHKNKLMALLRHRGRWDEYLAARDLLRDHDGVPFRVAQVVALMTILSPQELYYLGDRSKYGYDGGNGPITGHSESLAGDTSTDIRDALELELKEAGFVSPRSRGPEDATLANIPEESVTPVPVSPPSIVEPVENHLPPRPPEKMNVSRAKKDPWANLARSIPQSRKSSARAEAEWVHGHMLADADEVDIDTIPSRGAIALLKEAKRLPGVFYERIWSKLLPSRAQIENQERLEDDGRNVIGLIERVRKASRDSSETDEHNRATEIKQGPSGSDEELSVLSSCSERLERESELSAVDSGDGL